MAVGFVQSRAVNFVVRKKFSSSYRLGYQRVDFLNLILNWFNEREISNQSNCDAFVIERQTIESTPITPAAKFVSLAISADKKVEWNVGKILIL